MKTIKMTAGQTAKTMAALVVAGSLIFTSCTKDGPAGPTGATGATGATGNANVQAQTFSINSWNETTTGTTCYYTDLTVNALTASANANGAVEVFYSANNGTNWVAMPCTIYNSGGSNYTFNFATGTNDVVVQWIALSGFTVGYDPNTAFGTTIQIKVVVIPPAARLANPNVNLHSYEELKAAYHLK